MKAWICTFKRDTTLNNHRKFLSTVKRREILALVANCENLRSASPSLRLSDCTHTTYFSFSACDMFNGSLGTELCTWNTQNTTFIRSTTPQLREHRLQKAQFAPRKRHTKETTAPHSVQSLHTPRSLDQPEEVGTTA